MQRRICSWLQKRGQKKRRVAGTEPRLLNTEPNVPVEQIADVPREHFKCGATHQTLVMGEASLEDGDGVVPLRRGTRLVFPANLRHGLRALGNEPLVALGVHASPQRIVTIHGI
jgi:hypothetical protein